MVFSRRWQSQTALFLALGMTSIVTVPLTLARTAFASPEYRIAQRFPDTWRSSSTRLPAGTPLPVGYDKDKIVLSPQETVPVTLIIGRDVIGGRGTVLIPAGSQLKGKFQPVQGGTQFVSDTVTLGGKDGQSVPIDAVSNVITRTQTVTRRTDPNIFRGAAIGAGAGAILGSIFGDLRLWQVLGGAGLGVLTEVLLRGKKETTVIVVEPNTDLEVRLQSDFVVQ